MIQVGEIEGGNGLTLEMKNPAYKIKQTSIVSFNVKMDYSKKED